jgi:hypothetical protein
VFVATRALRQGDDFHFAVVGEELDDRLALEIGRPERRRSAVRAPGVDRLKSGIDAIPGGTTRDEAHR